MLSCCSFRAIFICSASYGVIFCTVRVELDDDAEGPKFFVNTCIPPKMRNTFAKLARKEGAPPPFSTIAAGSAIVVETEEDLLGDNVPTESTTSNVQFLFSLLFFSPANSRMNRTMEVLFTREKISSIPWIRYFPLASSYLARVLFFWGVL